ncbi:HigA family addiction module antidote protein [Pseudomonas psychrotolerans]|jgi:addiction module HigA family antidote|nr:HigA family addiction module antitoxin [Pseudomonas psychrotolerans]MBA1260679.1 HigA family addiction module antidote protein [Pseudomonas psychrotolerans]
MAMHSPPHPGAVLETVLDETPIKIAEAARKLHFSRVYLSGVVNCRKPIRADLAVRLERAGLSTARFWLSMQSAYDQWEAEQAEQPEVERIAAA